MEWTAIYRKQDTPVRLLPNQIADLMIISDASCDLACAIEDWLSHTNPEFMTSRDLLEQFYALQYASDTDSMNRREVIYLTLVDRDFASLD